MGQSVEIRVPDIGDFEEVEVVEVLVAKGDTLAIDDPIVSIESDKATMEIPATAEGVVAEVRVSEGDRVSEGTVLVVLDADADAASDAEPGEPAPSEADDAEEPATADEAASVSPDGAAEADAAAAEAEAEDEDEPSSEQDATTAGARSDETAAADDASATADRPLSAAASDPVPDREGVPHASPLVRRTAREFGVPIEQARGTGPHGRVLVDDLKRTVQARFASERTSPAAAAGGAIPPIPAVDFERFGPVHEEPLTKIQKVAGPGLHRSWLNVPHVTQHDEADVTELERFRRARGALAAERGVKLSPLLFVMKAVVGVLREFPKFRASLAPEGDRLIVKDSYHLGIAVDTEQGLVVPVIRDVDRKGILDLAEEVSATAERARARKLGPDDLQGACFTISSLGGIGGSAFTPIVNAPEVAILGLSKTRVQPVWEGPSPIDEAPRDAGGAGGGGEAAAGPAGDPAAASGRFVPRLVLPLSLSYDHRVIDGADAVRFTSRLVRVLGDPMHLLL